MASRSVVRGRREKKDKFEIPLDVDYETEYPLVRQTQNKSNLYFSQNLFPFFATNANDPQQHQGNSSHGNNYLTVYMPFDGRNADNVIFPEFFDQHLLFFKNSGDGPFDFSVYIIQHIPDLDSVFGTGKHYNVENYYMGIRGRRFLGKLTTVVGTGHLVGNQMGVSRGRNAATGMENNVRSLATITKIKRNPKKAYMHWTFDFVQNANSPAVYDIEYFRETIGFTTQTFYHSLSSSTTTSTPTSSTSPTTKLALSSSQTRPALECGYQMANIVIANLVNRYVTFEQDPNIGFWPINATFRVCIKRFLSIETKKTQSNQLLVFRPAFERPFVTLFEWSKTRSPQDVSILEARIFAYFAALSQSRLSLQYEYARKTIQDSYVYCSVDEPAELVTIWIHKISGFHWSFKIPSEEFGYQQQQQQQQSFSINDEFLFVDTNGVPFVEYVDPQDGCVAVEAVGKPFVNNNNNSNNGVGSALSSISTTTTPSVTKNNDGNGNYNNSTTTSSPFSSNTSTNNNSTRTTNVSDGMVTTNDGGDDDMTFQNMDILFPSSSFMYQPIEMLDTGKYNSNNNNNHNSTITRKLMDLVDEDGDSIMFVGNTEADIGSLNDDVLENGHRYFYSSNDTSGDGNVNQEDDEMSFDDEFWENNDGSERVFSLTSSIPGVNLGGREESLARNITRLDLDTAIQQQQNIYDPYEQQRMTRSQARRQQEQQQQQQRQSLRYGRSSYFDTYQTSDVQLLALRERTIAHDLQHQAPAMRSSDLQSDTLHFHTAWMDPSL